LVISRLLGGRRAIGLGLLVPGLLLAQPSGSSAESNPAKSPPEPVVSEEHEQQQATRAEERPPSNRCVHVVHRGDSLSRIAARHGVTRRSIIAANHLANPDALRVGQRLAIAGCKAAPARRAPEGGRALAEDDGTERLARVGPRRIPTRLFLAVPDFTGQARKFQWPIDGPVVSSFGWRGRGWHAGVDIQGEMGTPIRATAGGTVALSGRERFYGRMVTIRHADGFTSTYAHNLENLVEVGDEVVTGTVIATVGRTGHVSGSHLHLELRRDGTAYNPLHLLDAREAPPLGAVVAATFDDDEDRE